jgi:hypothetical protein
MTLYGHNIIVFGGTGVPFGQDTSNSIYLLNMHTLLWKKLDLKGDVPSGVYGCVCILLFLLLSLSLSLSISQSIYLSINFYLEYCYS